MGFSSEMMIVEHNRQMATDENYREDYERAMFDQWQEREIDEYFLKMEKFEDFFGDYRISHDGHEETFDVKSTLIDDDIPF